MSFTTFDLGAPILDALREKGYQHPTPIQQQAIPSILDGRDVLACAQTGTGKTAAFCLPILRRLSLEKGQKGIRALILAPTRELAIQVSDNLRLYGRNLNLRSTVIYGGVSQVGQVKQLRTGVDVVVATPGRLLDLVNQKLIHLNRVETLVLDEADRMLDMGFIRDIRRIIQHLPVERQNIFFSATMPDEVRELVSSILKDPVRIAISDSGNQPKIRQGVFFVQRDQKRALLQHIISEHGMENVLVFARTKHGADKIAKFLTRSGIAAEAFHGDKSQNARQRALKNFKKNVTRVLVATDIAARGIDVTALNYVINFELPDSAETYTHRIGRTGRAGTEGTAFSLCDRDEKSHLKNIRRIAANKLEVIEHPFI